MPRAATYNRVGGDNGGGNDCRLQMAGKIGIVTPYKDQRRALRREIGHRFGAEALQAIEISTVVRDAGLHVVRVMEPRLGWLPGPGAGGDHLLVCADE